MSARKKLPKILSDEEQARLLGQFNTRYPSSHRNLCMVRIMLDAGLRAGEVVAVRPEHLNMRSCKLVVREGKGARDRTLWISPGLRDLIGQWLDRRPMSDWLFPTRSGGQVVTRYLRSMVKRYAEKASIGELEKVLTITEKRVKMNRPGDQADRPPVPPVRSAHVGC